MILEFSRQIFEKYSNVKFHGNPSGRNQLLYAGEETGGQTDRQTGMTKLIVAFRNFVKAPKM
jgi:hypothetical protein